jgi:hypothetical protein
MQVSPSLFFFFFCQTNITFISKKMIARGRIVLDLLVEQVSLSSYTTQTSSDSHCGVVCLFVKQQYILNTVNVL